MPKKTQGAEPSRCPDLSLNGVLAPWKMVPLCESRQNGSSRSTYSNQQVLYLQEECFFSAAIVKLLTGEYASGIGKLKDSQLWMHQQVLTSAWTSLQDSACWSGVSVLVQAGHLCLAQAMFQNISTWSRCCWLDSLAALLGLVLDLM